MVEEKEHTDVGIAALVLGVLSIIMIFLPLIGMPLIIGIVAIPIAILATVFGYIARKHGDSYGGIGLLLGVITLILVIAFVVFATPVYVESGPLP